MKSKYLVAFVICAAMLGVFAFAQTPLTNPPPIIVNANSCLETDGGFNYFQAGSVSGSFWWLGANGTNMTYSGSLADTCVSSTLLLEGVCGSSVGAGYSSLAGAFYVDCSAAGVNWGCSAGSCLLLGSNNTNSTNSTGGNSTTNATMPDLIISSISYISNIINSTNSTNGTIATYSVSIDSVVMNNGTLSAGNSTTQITIAGTSVNLATYSLPPSSATTVTRIVTLTSGTYTVTSTADVLNVVLESNEANNALSVTLVLP
jgi:hypothetical protein